MDASVSPTVDADINDVCEFLLKIENASYPKRKRSVIKYTKLPDFDFDTQVSWPQPDSYTLQPRLRRIIKVDDVSLLTTRSLKPNPMASSRTNSTIYTQRKIVTIAENEENSRIGQLKTANKSTATVLKDGKNSVQRTTSRLTNPPKHSRVSKLSAITNNVSKKTDNTVTKPNLRNKASANSLFLQENSRFRSTKGRDVSRNAKPIPTTVKVNVSKNLVVSSESGKNTPLAEKKVSDNSRHITKQPLERTRVLTNLESDTQMSVTNDNDFKGKPLPVIHVPLDDQYETNKRKGSSSSSSSSETIERQGVLEIISTDTVGSVGSVDPPFNKVDRATDMGALVNFNDFKDFKTFQDVQVATIPPPAMVDRRTETTHSQPGDCCKQQNSYIRTELAKEFFDNLDIPNVTLTKDKNNISKEEIVTFCSNSSTNHEKPTFKIKPGDHDNHNSLNNSKSLIIGTATLTYTTKKKIDFHVVSGSDDNSSNQMPSPLDYPLNVVSVLKRKLNNSIKPQNSEEDITNKEEKVHNHCNNVHDLEALNCSYDFNSRKLIKPSDLISTLTVNTGLLQNDYVCEQFQRELHFIDSFFESLQYLESCSLSEKCFSQDDLNNPDYNSFLCKLENGTNAMAYVDDIETMASKSLCLLNLLIRDEQRRAKNLLFVLKMREDALKDFTKSQIIWLENKKKQDNTDVSTLKKKQRGALLKLQHECGEMQRMRKALLTLSEKRKAALMKTRHNIELKLKNNVDVDQILLGKKKLKRNAITDRTVAPLKCFDLSSSGCDDTTSSKHKSETPAPCQEHEPIISSAEKSIQTGDSILETIDQATDTAAENCVTVDGIYLNILFQNLSLPQIFSGGKQYEVNEEALRKIVQSSNNAHQKNLSDSDVIENFMDKIKTRDSDQSSSPSTAHSLVDEYDQYYKGLSDGGKSPVDSPDTECQKNAMFEVKDSCVQVVPDMVDHSDRISRKSMSTMTGASAETVLDLPETVFFTPTCACEGLNSAEAQSSQGSDVSVAQSQTGPLPVPPGAASSPEPPVSDVPDVELIVTESGVACVASAGAPLPPAPAVEAEELRRQQLAIEREIKALEQQQCQLLAVREIPDKPPPPYTPPHQTHAPPRAFLLDDAIQEKLHSHIVAGHELDMDSADSFDAFIQDICHESLSRQRTELSDEPWDACNLLPHKQEASREKVAQKTINEIKEILSAAPPTVVSGVGSRRSDHIDDILFSEWRRVEPQWTSLHADEAAVKNQVFESIFQKVLNDTIDQYKRTVLTLTSDPTE